MNNQLQVFNNSLFGEVRFINMEGKPFAVANDVAKALGYKNTSKATSDHCKGITKRYILTNGGQQELNIIPESDIYRLIIKSKLPQAEKFEQWVMEEVLPSIRKNGAYMTEQTLQRALTEPDFLIQLATTLKEEQEKRKLAEKQVQQKQIVIDKVIKDDSLFTIGTVGKALKPYCPRMGAVKIFKHLRQEEILMDAKGTQRHNLPYDRYNKYFEIKYVDSPVGTQVKTYFNGKGIKWFLDKLVKNGYLTNEDRVEVENKL